MNSRKLKIHAISTRRVTIRLNQAEGKGAGSMRMLNVYLDRRWAKPLPIYAWAIEHPEGVVVVDTGETAKSIKILYAKKFFSNLYHLPVKFQIPRTEERLITFLRNELK
jgi:hypothetical protein